MEWLPRTTRAQAMDVLSSQANIAGYKAVLLAANEYQRFMPMLMTAAGTVKAARVLILGAGVAGLQAIATAKRLGAVIEASDVRPAVKEQIESLGGKFLDVPFVTDEEREIAQGVGGYARPMPADWMRRQAELVHERAKQADIVITTALIPGRPAPVLIKEDTVKAMKPGAVLLDMAVEQGGNCPLTERDKIVIKHGVKIIGLSNLAGAGGRGCERPVCAQSAQLHGPAGRSEERRAHFESRRRDHRGRAGVDRRRGRQASVRRKA